MKIQFASDLHLEFGAQRAAINGKRLLPKGEILILAGDICYLKEEHFRFEFFNYCADHWKETYVIPGNHEFYDDSFQIQDALDGFELEIRSNVRYLNNKAIDLDGARMIFSTLWTNITDHQLLEQSLNDFHYCKFENRRFTANDHNFCHQSSFDYLNRALSDETTTKPTIVISHHVPFDGRYCNYPFETPLTEGFHVDMTELITKYKINYWIYGHNHFNQAPIEMDGTKFVTNQLGYVSREENRLFNRSAVIEI